MSVEKACVVYRCTDGSILLDWNETLWRYGYPYYPKHRCTELERGRCEGGPNLPRLFAQLQKKYTCETSDNRRNTD